MLLFFKGFLLYCICNVNIGSKCTNCIVENDGVWFYMWRMVEVQVLLLYWYQPKTCIFYDFDKEYIQTISPQSLIYSLVVRFVDNDILFKCVSRSSTCNSYRVSESSSWLYELITSILAFVRQHNSFIFEFNWYTFLQNNSANEPNN